MTLVNKMLKILVKHSPPPENSEDKLEVFRSDGAIMPSECENPYITLQIIPKITSKFIQYIFLQ